MCYRTNVFIDKISITIPVLQSDWEQSAENLFHVIHRGENLYPMASEGDKCIYQLSWKAFFAGKHGELVMCVIQAWPKPRYQDCGFLRIEWNPAHAGANGIREIYSMLHRCIPDFYGCLRNARLSRADVTADVHRIHIDGILAFTKSARTMFDPYTEEDQLTGFYLGSKESNRRLLIYDKLLEQTRGVPLIYLRPDGTETNVRRANKTRIEFRLRDLRLISDLHLLPNPLRHYTIALIKRAGEYSSCIQWQRFVSSMNEVGAQQALGDIPNRNLRKQYRNILDRDCTPTWFNREIWWAEAQNAITAALLIPIN